MLGGLLERSFYSRRNDECLARNEGLAVRICGKCYSFIFRVARERKRIKPICCYVSGSYSVFRNYSGALPNRHHVVSGHPLLARLAAGQEIGP